MTTPVWSASRNGTLYVVTTESAGKVRRVRATGRLGFAPSNMNGRRILGEWQEGTGRIVDDDRRRSEAPAVVQRKYGWQFSLATLLSRLRGSYQDRVVLELTLAPKEGENQ